MGTIPSETIEQIAAANDIVEVIGSYFPLKRAGANFKALCPFHQEKTPSFIVSPSRQTFHCFGCGVGGSLFRFVMEYEHVDFPSAVRKLGERAGITVVESRGAAEEDRQYQTRRKLLKLHAEASEWFHQNLIKSERGESARRYLKGRGIKGEIAKNWQLGYAPDEWDAFGNWARGQGYEQRDLLASGLVKARDENDAQGRQGGYDRFRGRVMFPIYNDIGEVIAFSGRLVKDEEGAAKYLNSPETPLFRKGNMLFGLHKSKRSLIEANCAIVCEGQLDLITLFETGIRNVVAPQGTAFTENQARILRRFVDEVVLCFDSDAAGAKAAERSLDALLQNDFIIRVVELPQGEDPDSLIRREGKEKFEKRVGNARDFFDYWTEREAANVDLSSAGAKIQAARRTAEIISRIGSDPIRNEVIYKAAARFDLPATDLKKLMPKLSRRSAESVQHDFEPVGSPQKIKQLCILALRDSEVRNFLLAQPWQQMLAKTPGTELLCRVLSADVRPEDPATIASFLASLGPEEEAIVSNWISPKRIPYTDRGLAYQWWQSLTAEPLERELEALKNKIRLPDLTAGEVVNLQKQILDLQEQLHEFSRPAGRTDT